MIVPFVEEEQDNDAEVILYNLMRRPVHCERDRVTTTHIRSLAL